MSTVTIDTYLLKAPEDLMRWWKDCAASEGVSFADWLRAAAHERAGIQPEPKRARQPAIVTPMQCDAGTPPGQRCRKCGRIHGWN
jgi:hypothetical protein